MIRKTTRQILSEFNSKTFFVRASISLRAKSDDEIYSPIVNGKIVEPNLNEIVVFSMSLLDMAMNSEENTIYLYRRSDIKKLYDTLTEFVDFISSLNHTINMTLSDKELKALEALKTLSSTVLKYNRTELSATQFNLNTEMAKHGYHDHLAISNIIENRRRKPTFGTKPKRSRHIEEETEEEELFSLTKKKIRTYTF